MSEIARMLARELEALREEDRRREERLTSLATQLRTRLEHLTEQLLKQQERNDALEAKVDDLSRSLTSLQDFERRLNGLAQSLRQL